MDRYSYSVNWGIILQSQRKIIKNNPIELETPTKRSKLIHFPRLEKTRGGQKNQKLNC